MKPARRRGNAHPNAHNVIKRVQFPTVSSPPPSDSGMPPQFSGAAGSDKAPASDRLGELLRLYSELSAEKKARAMDYVKQLHSLEHASESGMSASTVTTVGARGLGARSVLSRSKSATG